MYLFIFLILIKGCPCSNSGSKCSNSISAYKSPLAQKSWPKAGKCQGSTTYQVFMWNGRDFVLTLYAFDFNMILSADTMKLKVSFQFLNCFFLNIICKTCFFLIQWNHYNTDTIYGGQLHETDRYP